MSNSSSFHFSSPMRLPLPHSTNSAFSPNPIQWAGPTFPPTARRIGHEQLDISLSRVEARMGVRFTLLETQLMTELDSLREATVNSNKMLRTRIEGLEEKLIGAGCGPLNAPSGALSQESLSKHVASQTTGNSIPKPNHHDEDNDSEYTCSLCLSHSAREHSLEAMEDAHSELSDADAQSETNDVSRSFLDMDDETHSFQLVSSPEMEYDEISLGSGWSDSDNDDVVYPQAYTWTVGWIQNDADWDGQ